MLNYTPEAQEILNKNEDDIDDDDVLFMENLTVPDGFICEWAYHSSDIEKLQKVFDAESVEKIMEAFDIISAAEDMYEALAPEFTPAT